MNTLASNEKISIIDILLESGRYFSSNIKIILLLVLLVSMPIGILTDFVTFDRFKNINNISNYIHILKIISTIIGVVTSISIMLLVKNSIEGNITTFHGTITDSFSYMGRVILVNIRMSIYLIGLTFLFIIPGIIFGIYWMFSAHAVIFSDKSGKKALDYSKDIVRGQWWKILGYSLILLIAFFVSAFLIGLGIGGVNVFLPENNIIEFINNAAINFSIEILFSFFTIALTVLFLKARILHQTEQIINNSEIIQIS